MMNRRLKILAIFAVTLAAWPCVFAQENTSQTQAAAVVPADLQPTSQQLDRLFDAMRIKEQMATMTKMMPQIIQQQMVQEMDEMQKTRPELANRTPAQKEASAKVVGKFMQQAISLYGSDDIIADMKMLYQRHLTGNDVENLITFYGSPSGQHMLDMVPAVMQEFMPQAMQKIQRKMRPLIAEMSKELAEIAQSSGSTDKPGAAKPDQR
jgi:hypothetical protein